MNDKKYGAISSSVDPQEISVTVLAVAKFMAGLLVGAGFLTVADKTTLLATLPSLITDAIAIAPFAYAGWHSAEILFGIFQKVLVAVFKRDPVNKISPIGTSTPVA